MDEVETLLAQSAVWHRLYRAVYFIKEAKSNEPIVPIEWCFEIAAESLWSAVEIFNKRVATKADDRLGGSRSPTPWFQQNGPLVHRVRNGVVHHSKATLQLGGTLIEGKRQDFLWIDSEKVSLSDIAPVLQKVADEVGLHIIRTTGSGRLPLYGEGDLAWFETLTKTARDESAR